jgi:multisubunit Na+/H+ antiporter MnhE subunit
MYWYGWTATSVIMGAILGFLATLLPESVTRKIPLILVWLLPILSIPYLIWDLRQWWFHP